MNRLGPGDFELRRRPEAACRVAGLLITCSADCFAPEVLARQLLPEAWLVHRTPGNVIPPYGAGHTTEEELVERAVGEYSVGCAVVCGHHDCGISSHLLAEDGPADDFLLRDWLSHAEAARRCLRGAPPGDQRLAAARNILTQLANLRTHPAVAAAVAAGRLQLWGWLHAGELLHSGSAESTFDRPVALHPEQGRHLRRPARDRRRPPSANLPTPYLA